MMMMIYSTKLCAPCSGSRLSPATRNHPLLHQQFIIYCRLIGMEPRHLHEDADNSCSMKVFYAYFKQLPSLLWTLWTGWSTWCYPVV